MCLGYITALAGNDSFREPLPHAPLSPCPRAPSWLRRAGRDVIAITSVGGRTSGVGDHARLMARASANGGHGNDRPTQCIEVGLTTLGQPRPLTCAPVGS
jgi:hypothetical protein